MLLLFNLIPNLIIFFCGTQIDEFSCLLIKFLWFILDDYIVVYSNLVHQNMPLIYCVL